MFTCQRANWAIKQVLGCPLMNAMVIWVQQYLSTNLMWGENGPMRDGKGNCFALEGRQWCPICQSAWPHVHLVMLARWSDLSQVSKCKCNAYSGAQIHLSCKPHCASSSRLCSLSSIRLFERELRLALNGDLPLGHGDWQPKHGRCYMWMDN